MTKKAWFMSLLFPVLSMIGSIVYVIIFLTSDGLPVFVGIFGLAGGGIVPYVLIVRNKLDLSEYFLVKIILFFALAAAVSLTWTVFKGWISRLSYFLIVPVIAVIAEIVFAALQKTDRKTKICLVLSSMAWIYLGFALEIVVVFTLY